MWLLTVTAGFSVAIRCFYRAGAVAVLYRSDSAVLILNWRCRGLHCLDLTADHALLVLAVSWSRLRYPFSIGVGYPGPADIHLKGGVCSSHLFALSLLRTPFASLRLDPLLSRFGGPRSSRYARHLVSRFSLLLFFVDRSRSGYLLSRCSVVCCGG